MEAYLLDWLQLAVRWVHMIAGIAWIGASFYFVWLNNHLRQPDEPSTPDGDKDGEVHAIHGGGFYRVQRYALAPTQLPRDLHWFKWEAYTTWLTGMSLLVLVYYLNPQIYMVDTAVKKLGSGAAVGIGLAFIAAGWFFYDLVQRSPLGKNQGLFGAFFFAFFVSASWFICGILGGRAAYLHVGAMLGTIMVANVFFIIIPSQRELVNAKEQGRAPDKAKAELAKNRSLHNNYLTLPVLFIMISNHYPMTFSHEHNWIILCAISLGGALIRHWFNAHGQGKSAPWIWPAAALIFIAVIYLAAPRSAHTTTTPVSFAEVDAVIGKHCRPCHSENPTDTIFKIAPNGVKYNTPAQIAAMAVKIKQRAVDTNSMPMGNKTNMTAEERALLGRWIQQGAKMD